MESSRYASRNLRNPPTRWAWSASSVVHVSTVAADRLTPSRFSSATSDSRQRPVWDFRNLLSSFLPENSGSLLPRPVPSFAPRRSSGQAEGLCGGEGLGMRGHSARSYCKLRCKLARSKPLSPGPSPRRKRGEGSQIRRVPSPLPCVVTHTFQPPSVDFLYVKASFL
jgi:hypothetical protein